MQNINSVDKINDFYDGITFNPLLIIPFIFLFIGFRLLVKREEFLFKMAGFFIAFLSAGTITLMFVLSNQNLLM